MNKLIKVIKVLINTLVTMILIFGTLFVFLYIIGIEPYAVETGSMEPAIQRGSLSFINKHAKFDSIKEGDVIAFNIPTGSRATHRVVKKTEKGLETRGDSNNAVDGFLTTENSYIGKNILSIPKLGYLIMLLKTPRGKIIFITMIVVLLIIGFLFGDKKTKGKRFK